MRSRQARSAISASPTALPGSSAKANALAEQEGFAKFVSVQGHYNLIFREEEREMAPYCQEENIAMTPYSALAGGRLSKRPGETSKRLQEDSYARLKYGAAQDQDAPILARVAELADRRGVSMTEISLAWLLTKVNVPGGWGYQAPPYGRCRQGGGP